MSDTLQVVSWALEQSCKLRSRESKNDPDRAVQAVHQARLYSDCLPESTSRTGIIGDILTLGYTSARVPDRMKGRAVHYPVSGFKLSDSFCNVGGTIGLSAMCGACPANTLGARPAGCAGLLFQQPDSRQTQAQLEGIIARLGFENEVREVFLPTTPIWYGLWIRSPLSSRAVQLLRAILRAMHDENSVSQDEAQEIGIRDHLYEVSSFIHAMELAEERELPIHVSLAPPGHVDLGWHTIFPHCPICKAAARLPRWRRKPPMRRYGCEVCGGEFPPAETASMTRMGELLPDLRKVLGEMFPVFAKAYLVAGGLEDSDADEVVMLTEAWERERRKKFAQYQGKAQLE